MVVPAEAVITCFVLICISLLKWDQHSSECVWNRKFEIIAQKNKQKLKLACLLHEKNNFKDKKVTSTVDQAMSIFLSYRKPAGKTTSWFCLATHCHCSEASRFLFASIVYRETKAQPFGKKIKVECCCVNRWACECSHNKSSLSLRSDEKHCPARSGRAADDDFWRSSLLPGPSLYSWHDNQTSETWRFRKGRGKQSMRILFFSSVQWSIQFIMSTLLLDAHPPSQTSSG